MTSTRDVISKVRIAEDMLPPNHTDSLHIYEPRTENRDDCARYGCERNDPSGSHLKHAHRAVSAMLNPDLHCPIGLTASLRLSSRGI